MRTKEISYRAGDTEMSGFAAYPEDASNLPGVLVVHEWWGHTEYVRRRAEMLAGLGYAAFAVDLYGKGQKTELPDQAGQLQNELIESGRIEERFRAALDAFKTLPEVDASRVAAVGYCFGGGVVLSMARAGLPLKGVVSFHGTLKHVGPIAAGVNARFLVLTGDADPFVPAEDLQRFRMEMSNADLSLEVVEYPGVAHAFTNPKADQKGELYSLPLRYDPGADADSWDRMRAFLSEVLA